jgi:hypothetical protein
MSQPEVGASVVAFLADRLVWAFLQPLAWAIALAIVATTVWTCWMLLRNRRPTLADTLGYPSPVVHRMPVRRKS